MHNTDIYLPTIGAGNPKARRVSAVAVSAASPASFVICVHMYLCLFAKILSNCT